MKEVSIIHDLTPRGLDLQVTYRFVSVLNDQGFLEGRYVPVVDGQKESATPAPETPASTATLGSSNGDGSPPLSGGETDVSPPEPALKTE